MNLYNDYLNIIKEAVEADSSNFLQKGLDSRINESKDRFRNIHAKISNKEIGATLKDLSNSLGQNINYNQPLGLHPDFKSLKFTKNTEEHYIASAFIDIAASTNLFKKFDKETVFLINNAIHQAGINTILAFGGYVQRLQGDGLFAYFGGKNQTKASSVARALQAISVFSYFVKNDLKEFFRSQGIENISIRTGIDLGYDDDVLWANAGIGEISEVTTCSLHTSLASKMQSNATRNGIVIGDHLIKELSSIKDFANPVCHRTGDENDRYIFKIDEKKFFYTQYDFNWELFLKKQSFIAIDQNGIIQAKVNNGLAISSDLKPIAQLNKPYLSND